MATNPRLWKSFKAERIGYNAQYFSTTFKNYTGYTPSEFRESEH
ncbi:AraC family transcriptional regulator [Paenibacillus bouchesdurhonensis]|nr:AraC family transcriptional regulator [Paenibacillus bouchesdurhonensis]